MNILFNVFRYFDEDTKNEQYGDIKRILIKQKWTCIYCHLTGAVEYTDCISADG